MMRKFLALALLLIPVTALHAATISYNAVIGCGNTCVTVSLSWQQLFPPPSSAEVDDNFGNFLFGLDMPPSPVSSGSLRETISGLGPDDISTITNSQLIVNSQVTLLAFSSVSSTTPICGTEACLVMKDVDHLPVATLSFVATFEVPEPASWALAAGGGLALLLIRRRTRRRNFQT
jgi:hypothetical protein